ncbi:hypothetical protein KI688_012284 [Linnemannia hyalina]|uniref:Up-regulated during septation protein 1 domain-containing protein n=1 Tax=Linnemannia hyalina TaxID=64524 RepID=A0A9P7XXG2_9FUNG|nr:hypothetical protein KI688_012284 [Linnemannia hyalina]
MSDHKVASSRTLLSPYNHSSYSQSSDSLVHSLPTRKISSSNFIKLARQASDTAFRSVGLSRKHSDHNLREQATVAASMSSHGGGVYEQNPKVYLYQQHQQQQYLHQHVKTRLHHHPLRPQGDDTVPEEWAMNNQLLHTESCSSDDYYDPPPIVKPFASRSLRRNVSMPDMKGIAAAAAANAGQSSCEPRPSRATSPQPSATGARQVNRSRSRPRVEPSHFITTGMANNNNNTNCEPAVVTSNSNGPCGSTIILPKSTPVSSGDECSNIQRTPSRPPRSQNHISPHHNNVKVYQQHQNQIEQQRHHEQQRQRLLTRRQVLSDESLPEYGDAVLSVSCVLDGSNNNNSDNNTNNNLNSKDLPPTPSGPPPSFSLPTRGRRCTESNSETDSITSPTGSLAPVMLPAMGTSLTRNGSSNGGIIPQDVLRSMDPKDVQRVVSSAVIASRVYKVLNPEQLESLKKEQEGLQQFVEAMNVSLHIETRMRDASSSLIRLYESNLNIDAVKAANSQLHATTFKMDDIVQKSQQAMWRLLAIQRLLLQHETAVLNAGLRRLDNENRDLSRAVMNLETARGQEKEEKLKWKKEHTRLKVQSILFTPTSPITATAASEVAVPPTPQLQLVQEQLSAMENYAKELSEDVLQKDEKLGELKIELGAVKGWADDFEVSLQQAKQDSCSEVAAPLAEETLQEQLSRLQSTIEADYKDFHVHTDELQVKVDLLTEENLAFITAASAPSKTCASDDDTSSSSASSLNSSPLGLTEQEQQERQARRSWRIRAGFSSSRESIQLHNVLRESLWELDRQIELDERLSASSSSISNSSSASSSCRNSSASTVSSAFSLDNTNTNGSVKHAGNESPLVISRRSSSRSTASASSPSSPCTGRLSRTSSTSSSSKFGLREQVLMRDMCSSPEIAAQGLGLVVECEDVGEGLDTIVKEIGQIVMHKQQE